LWEEERSNNQVQKLSTRERHPGQTLYIEYLTYANLYANGNINANLDTSLAVQDNEKQCSASIMNILHLLFVEPINSGLRSQQVVFALKYMADVWQPSSIVFHQSDPENKTYSISLLNESNPMLQISARLFCIMLEWEKVPLSSKGMTYILKIINKLLNRYVMTKMPDSEHGEKNLNQNFWKGLIQCLYVKKNEMTEKVFCYEEFPISLEMSCVNCLNNKIVLNSANGTLVSQAIELSSIFMKIYLSKQEVSKFLYTRANHKIRESNVFWATAGLGVFIICIKYHVFLGRQNLPCK
jgi:hypothetical protein